MISYGKQTIDKTDIDSVIKVLKGEWLTQGPFVEKFENDLKINFKAKYACAVSNGTAALHLTALALGWNDDDYVILPPITFLSTANCIVYAKANPVFVDIDSHYYCLDPNLVEQKVKYLRKKGKNIKAIIGVDYAGHPCDWESLRSIADNYDLILINDNCHAIGAEYKNDFCYSLKYADVVCHSYHPVKPFTTGEGGAVLTNNYFIDKKVRLLRTHGVTKDPEEIDNFEGPWYYEMVDIGFNYRITDLQCALGSNQLKKLQKFVSKRKDIALKYENALRTKKPEIVTPKCAKDTSHGYHLYPILIDFQQYKIDKVTFFKKMYKAGINLQVHYIPLHYQPFYMQNFGYEKGDFPISEKFYKEEVSLPIYPDLTNKELLFVVELINRYLIGKKK